MSLTVTNNNTAGIVIENGVTEVLTCTAGAEETWPAGTVLGRVTANGNMGRYDAGASDGTQTPIAVLAEELVFAAASSTQGAVALSGQFRLSDLTQFGVGALTVAQQDALRDYGIIARSTTQLNEQDNQT